MSLKKGQRKGNNGNHGAKKRSGRKPKAITILKRQLVEERKDDAVYAYSLFVSVMRDDSIDTKLRLDCAKEVMDRVLGKSHQSITIGDLSNEDVAKAIEPILARLGVRLVPPVASGLDTSADRPGRIDSACEGNGTSGGDSISDEISQ